MGKCAQFLFGDGELRHAAIQADHEFRKDPHDGFVQALESRKMDGNFAAEPLLVFGSTSLTGHKLTSRDRRARGGLGENSVFPQAKHVCDACHRRE